jgi:hypothetical protein
MDRVADLARAFFDRIQEWRDVLGDGTDPTPLRWVLLIVVVMALAALYWRSQRRRRGSLNGHRT